jgi:hypothetical protein
MKLTAVIFPDAYTLSHTTLPYNVIADTVFDPEIVPYKVVAEIVDALMVFEPFIDP